MRTVESISVLSVSKTKPKKEAKAKKEPKKSKAPKEPTLEEIRARVEEPADPELEDEPF